MRLALASIPTGLLLAVALCGCPEHGSGGPRSPDGDPGNPSGDGGITPVPDAAAFDCRATGPCLDGPACGTACCGAGEHCDSGKCVCGDTGTSCTGGDKCEVGGPLAPQVCGRICCGLLHPCPI